MQIMIVIRQIVSILVLSVRRSSQCPLCDIKNSANHPNHSKQGEIFSTSNQRNCCRTHLQSSRAQYVPLWYQTPDKDFLFQYKSIRQQDSGIQSSGFFQANNGRSEPQMQESFRSRMESFSPQGRIISSDSVIAVEKENTTMNHQQSSESLNSKQHTNSILRKYLVPSNQNHIQMKPIAGLNTGGYNTPNNDFHEVHSYLIPGSDRLYNPNPNQWPMNSTNKFSNNYDRSNTAGIQDFKLKSHQFYDEANTDITDDSRYSPYRNQSEIYNTAISNEYARSPSYNQKDELNNSRTHDQIRFMTSARAYGKIQDMENSQADQHNDLLTFSLTTAPQSMQGVYTVDNMNQNKSETNSMFTNDFYMSSTSTSFNSLLSAFEQSQFTARSNQTETPVAHNNKMESNGTSQTIEMLPGQSNRQTTQRQYTSTSLNPHIKSGYYMVLSNTTSLPEIRLQNDFEHHVNPVDKEDDTHELAVTQPQHDSINQSSQLSVIDPHISLVIIITVLLIDI